MLGGTNCEVLCIDGKTRQCIIRNKFCGKGKRDNWLTRGKWILVGRLDVNTSGLLLVTTDGELANRLAHPSSNLEREYLVRVSGELTASMQALLKSGVELEDGKASVKRIKQHGKPTGRNYWYELVLEEGRNRIVRRLMDYYDLQVSRLMRVRFGPIKLERQLGVGKYQEIDIGWMRRQLGQ